MYLNLRVSLPCDIKQFKITARDDDWSITYIQLPIHRSLKRTQNRSELLCKDAGNQQATNFFFAE